ncbi:MAG: hypothetical protein ACR2JC_00915 [Chloroflexota bacterium]|nr:MAG: hypothetical protein DLM70_08720 [Chloroflexota bacterium]
MKSPSLNSSGDSESNNFQSFFNEPKSVQELARMQGVSAITDTRNLLAEFWPESDSIEEFIATVEHRRSEGG